MEILRAETNEFPHLKNTDGPKNNSSSSASSSSTIDDDEDDQFSNVSTIDDKRTIKSPVNNEDKSKINDENSINNSSLQTPIVQSIVNRTTSTIDYTRHRERLAKELKDYEDRWLAHRNFLLYTQAFSMKPEDRERLFSQINSTNNDETFSRLSKEERDRFLAAALYNQQQQQQQQNPYNFHQYPWTTPSTTATSSLIIPPIPSNTTDQPQQQQQQQQPKSPSSDDSGNQSNSGSTTEWTFEEQFRQLYELSDEPKRKEFLDDLFAFMQKRGTPVNRIPIMAKHVLDLYELFRLVVGKGGLVEVINKKLWREVTKGLNLPSSITSAAFTLRTQYMKYLYPYECEKLQLSSPGELQAAIEGNRREGRRPSYAFEYSSPPQIMPPPPPPPTSTSAFLASPLAHRPLDPNHGHEAMQHAAMAAAAALSHPFFLAAAAASSRDGNHSSIEQSSTPRIPSFDDHHHHHNHLQSSSPTSIIPTNKLFERSSTATKRSLSPSLLSKQQQNDDNNNINSLSKKSITSINNIRSTCFTPVTTNNNSSLLSPVSKLKIIAKENNPDQQQSNEKSITISIELNGIAYQGTLYATMFTGSKE
ncbi:unnamed protein product [Rotaria sp. Silwood2]|nr:unnamed protein product [Rotaria sp. Silwood2]CAF2685750.1 unnamed protein product [Rotaria sp. Silwood2]CAF2949259.1 unnamed protein product [Rotaria sp. Silwood2]CAF3093945.1 unnamed protein product [Rotaria sp. Silwood2]CAF4096394.1 unnamed protein product [Rotaria sp. Silwood2]